MATQVQFRRGTTSQNNAFTGAQGELTVDTDVKTIRIHDGTTVGGHVVPTLTASQTFTNKIMSTNTVWNGTSVGLAYGGTGAAISGVAGAVVYSQGSNLALSLAGTSGQVLTSGGTSGPTWVNSSALSVGTSVVATTATNLAAGSAGYIPYQSDTNTTAYITPGVQYQVLQSNGTATAAEWVSGIQNISLVYLSGTTDSSSTTTGVLRVAGGASIEKKLYIGTNLSVGGTAAITGATTLTGSLAANGGITVDGTAFVVADTTGNVSTTGTLSATGNFSINTDKFTVAASTGNTVVAGTADIAGDLAVNGGDLTTSQTTFNLLNSTATTVNAFGAGTAITIGATSGTMTLRNPTIVGSELTQNLFNTVATTLNIGGAATTISIGAATGTLTINNANTVITGNLTVNGTTTTINSTVTSIDDIEFELGSVATPTDTTAIGGGIRLKGATDKTINWSSIGWTSSEDFNIVTGKVYEINGTEVLSASTVFNTQTTASLAPAATTLTIGETTGTATIRNATISLPNATAITTGQTTVALLNTTATTVNAFGASTAITLGNATSATLTLNPETVVGANTTQNLFNTVATTLNIGGAATAVNIGTNAGTNTLRGTLAIPGSTSGTVKLTAPATTANTDYILPNAYPTINGMALVSTTGGTMSWATAHAGTNGDYQFNSIGVGTPGSNTAGEIRATNQITSYYSDDRLKTRGVNIENALEKVLALNGFHYTANETAQALGFIAKPEVGLSAQEVQAVLPEVVVDAPIDSQYLTIHYERMIPLLVEAIKAQQKQIEELKAKLGN
jgi:hypothetical protein